jgi:hypothetical protein
VIQTARTEEEINEGIVQGYTPLIKDVISSDEIKVMYTLERNLHTGEFTLLKDSEENHDHGEGIEKVLDEEYYYPYQFPMPFAAYLIPKDIEKGERVILEDIIEDIVGKEYGKSIYRMESAEAIWNGENFEIDGNDYSDEGA